MNIYEINGIRIQAGSPSEALDIWREATGAPPDSNPSVTVISGESGGGSTTQGYPRPWEQRLDANYPIGSVVEVNGERKTIASTWGQSINDEDDQFRIDFADGTSYYWGSGTADPMARNITVLGVPDAQGRLPGDAGYAPDAGGDGAGGGGGVDTPAPSEDAPAPNEAITAPLTPAERFTELGANDLGRFQIFSNFRENTLPSGSGSLFRNAFNRRFDPANQRFLARLGLGDVSADTDFNSFFGDPNFGGNLDFSGGDFRDLVGRTADLFGNENLTDDQAGFRSFLETDNQLPQFDLALQSALKSVPRPFQRSFSDRARGLFDSFVGQAGSQQFLPYYRDRGFRF